MADRPNIEQIEEQLYAARDSRKNFTGMTYQEGVDNALSWVTGLTTDKPMED